MGVLKKHFALIKTNSCDIITTEYGFMRGERAMSRRDKQDKDGGGIIGWIITLIFIAILAGGIYFLVNLFKSVEINEVNLAGTWKLSGDPTEYFIINPDNTLRYYTQYANGMILEDADFNYTLEENENGVMVMTMVNVKSKKDKREYKITKLSNAEISILRNGKEFRNFTKVNIF